MYSDLKGKRILVGGAGVTGSAVGKSLTSGGAQVTFVDQSQVTVVGFQVLTPEEVTISEFDYLMISPGWRPDHPILVAAVAAQVPVLNEIDYAWSCRPPKQRWIALTGTNGKTSTVELTAAMARKAGLNAIACGNVGLTAIEAVESSESYDLLVLELSSFQLHWMQDAKFSAIAILNIAQDHLDWHGGFSAYAQAKLSLLDRTELAILNGDDAEVVTRAQAWRGEKRFFCLDTPGAGEIGIVEELLVDRAFVSDPQEAAMIAELSEVTPTVPHNVANALAAAGLARAIGISHEAIREAIVEFTPGKHRIETILVSDGITWINDSKATNPHAALASLMSALSVIWIAGGLAKGAAMDEIAERAKGRIKAAIIFGADRELIATALREKAPAVVIEMISPPSEYVKGGADNSLMEQIVERARKLATTGDTVLLAPACASMDQFLSYSDRGERFTTAVRKVLVNGH
jgi:UDP-N-acetylmuramoylalanine--D-glutamate ligase